MTIAANVVKELRDQTGAGMMDCKRALSETGGDLEAAKDWLRKRGQAIADKKAARQAKDGLIYALISDDGSVGVILELNCETDFVARNSAFVQLCSDLARQIAEGGPGTRNDSAEEFLQVAAAASPNMKIEDLLKQHVATLGENIGLARFARIQTDSATGVLQSYIHPPGKLGVLVELKVEKPETRANADFRTFAQDLAMHIAAASPEYLNRESVAPAAIVREKEIYAEQARNEGKPDKVAEKIVEGRLNKYYQQVCLLEQEFVKDPELNITKLAQQIAKQAGDAIRIVRFERMRVGG